MSIFAVGGFCGAIASGLLSDIFGRKPIFFLGVALFISGAILHTSAVDIRLE